MDEVIGLACRVIQLIWSVFADSINGFGLLELHNLLKVLVHEVELVKKAGETFALLTFLFAPLMVANVGIPLSNA